MYLVAIAWIYVVLMMAAAESSSPNGPLIGAVFTALLYGALPLGIVLYIMGAPGRRRARRAREAAESQAAAASAALQPDGGDHAAGHAVAAERKEP